MSNGRDARDEIPAWAFLNAQIIQDALSAGDSERATRKVEKDYGLRAGDLRIPNVSYVLGLLYCLIVVPRELWDRNQTNPFFDRQRSPLFLDGVEMRIPLDSSNVTPEDFLRHLRNAVAHARFSIAADGTFSFWDQKNEDSSRNFDASLSENKLGWIVSKVGADSGQSTSAAEHSRNMMRLSESAMEQHSPSTDMLMPTMRWREPRPLDRP